MTDAVNAQTEGLCRKVMLKAGRFNQHVQVGCLLVEVGNNRNTLGEALASMPYLRRRTGRSMEQPEGQLNVTDLKNPAQAGIIFKE